MRPAKKARSLALFAQSLRLPDGPSGPRNGREGDLWVPSTEPTQAQFLRAMDSGDWRKATIVAPSQRGKTLKAILCPLLHAVADCQQSVGFVLPSLDKLSQSWDGKLRPAIEGTGYGKWLPTIGPGSRGGKPPVLTMRNPETGTRSGLVYFMAMGTGGRETQVSMVSPQLLLIDEADDADSSGQISLICKRTSAWGKQGRSYICSTVNERAGRAVPDANDPDSSHPILMLFREGSQHKAHHKCPHCAGFFVPALEHLDAEAAQITCPLCSVIWSEDDRISAINNLLMIGKHESIADGVVVPGVRESDSYSELTTIFDYHMTVLTDVCAEIRTAKSAEMRGEYSLMRTVVQKMFCRAYVEPAGVSEITNVGLAAVSSRSDYVKRLVPSWVNYLVGTVDVQGDRHYYLITGVGPDDRHCIIDWGYEYLVPKGEARQPTPADRRRVNHEIDVKFNEGWQQEGREERIAPPYGMRGIDVGYATDEIVSWLRGMGGWRALRGASRDTMKNLGAFLPLPAEAKAFLEVRKPDGWPCPVINVFADATTRWVHAGLLRDPYSPASIMLPKGLKSIDDLALHLSGKLEKTDKDGHTLWFELRKRHDYLDLLVYAIGLSKLRAGIQSAQGVHLQRSVRVRGNVGNYLTGNQ